ncbi:LuxR C-terminal-related transcriptional regulator [Paractinoplanes rhizophilus]|uniref:LuxR C-terminal-related transcriptional regulator n=1 Tax=Paractinoplanes rhizophilus TaxID=1416877 RepID=UPI00366F6735
MKPHQARPASAERDQLLATKLVVPGLRAGSVPRPWLTTRLEEALAQGTVLVSAPAGAGKTSLLAHWARGTGRSVAWLSLDEGDSDPIRFWRHAAGALGLSGRAELLLPPPLPPSCEPLVTALINELASEPAGHRVLVLDDYHLVDSPVVHESLTVLAERRPPGLNLVLAGRSDPPLALARLRARGQLAELRFAELRLTAAETAAIVRQATGAPVSMKTAADLTARTEGWAAGVQLAALSMRGRTDPAAFVAGLTGSHRHILDFLAEEVLDAQDRPTREFLLHSSILDHLTGPLCDVVLGRRDSQAMLEHAERDGLFLIPLDDVRGRWRYHHLFADVLRARLRAEDPDGARDLHRRAAVWYEDRSLPDQAVRHRIAGDDLPSAARLIESYYDETYTRHGEGATLHRWLAALPEDLLSTRPRLLLARAMLLTDNRVADALRLLDRAEQAAAEPEFAPTVGRDASLLANFPAAVAVHRGRLATLRGDADGAAEQAAIALAAIGPDELPQRLVAEQVIAVADWLRGRLAAAEERLTATLANLDGAGQAMWTARGGYRLAQIQCGRGDLDASARTCRQMLSSPAAGAGYAGLAWCEYQRDHLDAALRHTTTAIPLCRQLQYTQPLAGALATQAWIHLARGDRAAAKAAIDEAAEASPGAAVIDLLNPIPAQRARLLLALGDVDAAERWTRTAGLRPDHDPSYAREPAHLVLARVLIARRRPRPALALLDKLHAAAAAQDRIGSLIEIGALQALAGRDTLADAVVLAGRQGHIRVFADEGPPMAALVRRLDPATAPPDYLAALRHSSAPTRAAGPAEASGLVDPLTVRELEVLRLIATGRSNQAIARDLVVTVDTVKKHVSHVLEKLGAANRTEAIARARELRLLPM